jgi:hypothetical protein
LHGLSLEKVFFENPQGAVVKGCCLEYGALLKNKNQIGTGTNRIPVFGRSGSAYIG